MKIRIDKVSNFAYEDLKQAIKLSQFVEISIDFEINDNQKQILCYILYVAKKTKQKCKIESWYG